MSPVIFLSPMTRKPRGETTIVAIRLTAHERRKMEPLATRLGLGLSTWMRQLALAAVEAERAKAVGK